MTPDIELLTAWGAGDKQAGGELIRRHFDTVYRFFCTKVDDQAEDLVQRTFLGCIEGRERIRDQLNFRAYLLGVARKQLLRYFRSKRRDGAHTDIEDASVHDLQGSPSKVLAQRREQRLLLTALRRIPLDFQILLELYYWEDMKVAEIASVIEAPDGTVKRRLWRARDLLRKQIGELAGSDDLARSTVDNLERWAHSLRDQLGRAPSE